METSIANRQTESNAAIRWGAPPMDWGKLILRTVVVASISVIAAMLIGNVLGPLLGVGGSLLGFDIFEGVRGATELATPAALETSLEALQQNADTLETNFPANEAALSRFEPGFSAEGRAAFSESLNQLGEGVNQINTGTSAQEIGAGLDTASDAHRELLAQRAELHRADIDTSKIDTHLKEVGNQLQSVEKGWNDYRDLAGGGNRMPSIQALAGAGAAGAGMSWVAKVSMDEAQAAKAKAENMAEKVPQRAVSNADQILSEQELAAIREAGRA